MSGRGGIGQFQALRGFANIGQGAAGVWNLIFGQKLAEVLHGCQNGRLGLRFSQNLA